MFYVFGNNFVTDKYGLFSECSKEDEIVLNTATQAAQRYGVEMKEPYGMKNYLSENEIIKFGNSELKILHVPGHTPGHLAFVNEEQKIAIVGDVLFSGSIGRTDLPGGNFETLAESIKTKLYTLPNETLVFPGHGTTTTIKQEKDTNPFVKE